MKFFLTILLLASASLCTYASFNFTDVTFTDQTLTLPLENIDIPEDSKFVLTASFEYELDYDDILGFGFKMHYVYSGVKLTFPRSTQRRDWTLCEPSFMIKNKIAYPIYPLYIGVKFPSVDTTNSQSTLCFVTKEDRARFVQKCLDFKDDKDDNKKNDDEDILVRMAKEAFSDDEDYLVRWTEDTFSVKKKTDDIKKKKK